MFFIHTNKRTAIRRTLRGAFDLVIKDMPGVSHECKMRMGRILETWPLRHCGDVFSMMVPMRFHHAVSPMVCEVTWVRDTNA